jgi:hypothetical protein
VLRFDLGDQLGRILREQTALPVGETTHERRPVHGPNWSFAAPHLLKAACAENDDLSIEKHQVQLPICASTTAGRLTGKAPGLCDLHDHEELSVFHSRPKQWTRCKVSSARRRLSAALSA